MIPPWLYNPTKCLPSPTETPGQISWAGRALGADTQDVLKDWLGE